MKINATTDLYALLGNPVSHSLGPAMHNAVFSHLGYDGVYLAFNVIDIGQAISSVRALGIKGVSITIPHKVGVMPFLDEIEADALKIGAVNTVTNNRGILTGYNTDCAGALRALSEQAGINGKDVVILGAGGAARAIGFGIISRGGRLTIANRTRDRGQALADDLKAVFCPLAEVHHAACQILINTTPVGMTPDIREMPVAKSFLKKYMLVMDIVYNPLKTRLLREAEDAGSRVVDGVSMFVYQGAVQSELWTGQKAPVRLMRRVVIDRLKMNS
ncbi:MAG: shikimate dehydrogenase [Desulfobacterales bacterium]|nr:shikimate dehydrogenase [Desulfobacterales bacterium]